MFTYYLNTLHEFHEKSLTLGHAMSCAWTEMITHMVDGQYLIGRVVLHPATLQLESPSDALWAGVGGNAHQKLVMEWVDEGAAKITRLQAIAFAVFGHNAAGWGAFGHEFVSKLKRDAGPDYAEALNLIDKTLQDVVSVESAVLKSAGAGAKVPRTAHKVQAA